MYTWIRGRTAYLQFISEGGDIIKKIKYLLEDMYFKFKPAILSILGFFSFSVAAFMLNPIIGFLVVGVSLFTLEWRVDPRRLNAIKY